MVGVFVGVLLRGWSVLWVCLFMRFAGWVVVGWRCCERTIEREREHAVQGMCMNKDNMLMNELYMVVSMLDDFGTVFMRSHNAQEGCVFCLRTKSVCAACNIIMLSKITHIRKYRCDWRSAFGQLNIYIKFPKVQHPSKRGVMKFHNNPRRQRLLRLG